MSSWWGSGGGSGDDPPEAEMSVGGACSGISEEAAELRDLKSQFEEQESLLGQLKGVLKSNEAKLQNKEKEVKVIFNSNFLCVGHLSQGSGR